MSKTTQASVKFNTLNKRIRELYEIGTRCNTAEGKDLDRLLKQFLVRFKDAERYREQMEDIYTTLMSDPSSDESKRTELDRVFNEYQELFYSIQVMHSVMNMPQSCTSKQSASHKSSEFHLPKISLAKFSGVLVEWPNFIAVFNSLIHNNEHLGEVEKMHYLLSVLDKEPLGLVRHLPISMENYSVAYTLLMERYNNVRIIADKHIDAILGLSNLMQINIKTLTKFVFTIKENTQALQALKFDVGAWSFLLLHIILKKLPSELRNKFESNVDATQIPTYEELLRFLENQLRILENVSGSTHKPSSSSAVNIVNSNSNVSNNNFTCPCCSDAHSLYRCPKFDAMPPTERKSFVMQHKLCFNCLRTHPVSRCSSRSVCLLCKGRHHTKLHVNNTPYPTPALENSTPASVQNQSLHSADAMSTMVLGTAVIHIQDVYGDYHFARALIDSGSQVSIITENLAQRLRLPRKKSGTLLGLGGSVGQTTRGVVHSNIKSVTTSSAVISSDFVVLGKITGNLPSVPVDRVILQRCHNLILADKNFIMPGHIDLLLGVGLYDQIFDGRKISLGDDMPTAYYSIFGWVIMGKALAASYDTTAVSTMACTMDLSLAMSRFWEVEEPPKQLLQDPEAIQAERHFTETHRRDNTGRFIVRLPFKVNRKPLGDTHLTALKRFHNLERRLLKDDVLRELYVEFMQDYLNAGHMREVNSPVSSDRYYIPHHGVLKEHSSSTKLRAVFDASSPSSTGVSLNQILMPGPKLQQNIEDIIVRFRIHKIVFTGDIRQMYRQIKMADEDCKFQTIFWRESPEHQLKQYELSTVTYGVSSSAFQAIRVIHELAYINRENHPEASRALLEDSFVDDIVTGGSSLDSAQTLLQQIVAILGQGGFALRKWSSNSPELLALLPADHCESPYRFNAGDNIFKILGIEWNSKTDSFLYRVSEMSRVMTKRGVLSNIARLYDPCGFLAPVVFRAKVFMQALWSLESGWDDPLPPEHLNSWQSFLEDFHHLNQISIPRRIVADQPVATQLHGFSDASERGYAACIYLRVENSCGSTLVQLLTAKSRVAPLKQKLTIPKLELSGALLLARLMQHASNILHDKLVVNSIHAWTDSSIVLSWLNTSPHKLQTFEGNRVSQIQMLMPNVIWGHVPSTSNPADPASRGISSSELVSHPLWWSPPWLEADTSTWPGDIPLVDESDLPGVKPSALVSAVAQTEVLPLSLDSIGTFSKLQSVVGWCKRFLHNSRNPSLRRTGPLSVAELTDSLTTIVKFVQSTAFADALELLRVGKQVRGSLMRLNPFTDEHGLLRVGGRLVKSELNYAARHPLLLPKDHRITMLIIEHYHRLFLHPGVGTLQTLLQQKFWILSARRVIKQVIFKCHRCYRLRPKSIEPFMGDLPSSRVTTCRPFQRVGVDFAGPFMVKTSKARNARSTKAYLCIFVCFTTKCVHMEIVSELSTEAFVACLDRFVSRRGRPTDIFSDCGTNFVGARNYLKQIDHFLKESSDKIYKFLSHQQINWHLNPPASPHMGGLWESAVRSAKLILGRVIGERNLLFEELATIFAKVEAALNSRPLCSISSDPNDLDVLTPGHFLIGQPLLALPEQNLERVPISPLKRWQLLRQITQHFWQRWQSEYLHTLIHRPKWLTKTANVQVGDLVLIKDSSPPLQWRKARVVRICPGADGIVRVVELRTASGTLLRPVAKLCPLLSNSNC